MAAGTALMLLPLASSAIAWSRRRKKEGPAVVKVPSWQKPRMSTSSAVPMGVHVLRLQPGDDIVASLRMFAQEREINAGCVLSCVGSTSRTTLRPAGLDIGRVFGGEGAGETFEIVSLVGTFSADAHNLHMAVSGKDCTTYGGCVLFGCTVHTTAEIVVGEVQGRTRFIREKDDMTGYKELRIEQLRQDDYY
eukprot:CAMPEP_0185184398 /NCGR_PEP_ID=MMETSP1140-20130426/2560_1 /TAXON_ID=298111 /ORGANISM="Pavlova sp., Strain CCMP459" /LENGTH=191 /DNA_ID=CAMNT_0027750467 /DNA_START=65 /DNA_END=640 /DNA_ORIENTATION=+